MADVPDGIVMLGGKPHPTWPYVLDKMHRAGLLEIQSELVQIPDASNGNVAIVKATVVLKGEPDNLCFEAYGDASPANVKSHMVSAIIRLAECVPLSAQILTGSGWKRHSQLVIGESVLAYDLTADMLRWTPLEAVSVFEEPQATVRMKGRSFSAVCTPEHTWAQQVQNGYRRLIKTHALRNNSLIVAAPAEGGNHPLTAREAAIIGWIATDGTARMVKVGPYGPYLRVTIAQSKPIYVAELADLLGELASVQTYQPRERDFGTHVSSCLPAYKFELHAGFARDLLTRAGLYDKGGLCGWQGLSEVVLALSAEARATMFDAMLKGDGTRRRGGESWTFGQKAKSGVSEAFELLATLEGRALGSPAMSSIGNVPVREVRANRFVSAANLSITPDEPQPVWCPTTAFGTWVMRQNGFITITGNTRAKGRAGRDSVNIGQTMFEEMPPDEETALPANPARPARSGVARDAAPRPARPDAGPDATAAAPALQPYFCAVCGIEVEEDTARGALKHFNQVLCLMHGKAELAAQRAAAERELVGVSEEE